MTCNLGSLRVPASQPVLHPVLRQNIGRIIILMMIPREIANYNVQEQGIAAKVLVLEVLVVLVVEEASKRWWFVFVMEHELQQERTCDI